MWVWTFELLNGDCLATVLSLILRRLARRRLGVGWGFSGSTPGRGCGVQWGRMGWEVGATEVSGNPLESSGAGMALRVVLN